MKKTGIIKAISQKSGGKNAFTLRGEQTEGKDIWFNGYGLDAKKGDEVEFELIINEGFNNFSKLKVTKEAPQPDTWAPSTSPEAPLQSINNSEIALRLTESIIAQEHGNLVGVESAVGMYEIALNKLNQLKTK